MAFFFYYYYRSFDYKDNAHRKYQVPYKYKVSNIPCRYPLIFLSFMEKELSSSLQHTRAPHVHTHTHTQQAHPYTVY